MARAVFQQKALFSRPVFARARRLCLTFPETTEALSHGHPTFRVGTKTFCAFEIHQRRPSIAVKISAAEFSTEVAAGRMFATPYGRGAWISLWVDEAIDWKELAVLIERAWDGVANTRLRALKS